VFGAATAAVAFETETNAEEGTSCGRIFGGRRSAEESEADERTASGALLGERSSMLVGAVDPEPMVRRRGLAGRSLRSRVS